MGECALRDVAIAYAHDVSQYSVSKRVVIDTKIGPLTLCQGLVLQCNYVYVWLTALKVSDPFYYFYYKCLCASCLEYVQVNFQTKDR